MRVDSQSAPLSSTELQPFPQFLFSSFSFLYLSRILQPVPSFSHAFSVPALDFIHRSPEQPSSSHPLSFHHFAFRLDASRNPGLGAQSGAQPDLIFSGFGFVPSSSGPSFVRHFQGLSLNCSTFQGIDNRNFHNKIGFLQFCPLQLRSEILSGSGRSSSSSSSWALSLSLNSAQTSSTILSVAQVLSLFHSSTLTFYTILSLAQAFNLFLSSAQAASLLLSSAQVHCTLAFMLFHNVYLHSLFTSSSSSNSVHKYIQCRPVYFSLLQSRVFPVTI